jgi:hypothetical protein
VLVEDGSASDSLSGWLTLDDVPCSGRSLLELDQDEIEVSHSSSFGLARRLADPQSVSCVSGTGELQTNDVSIVVDCKRSVIDHQQVSGSCPLQTIHASFCLNR